MKRFFIPLAASLFVATACQAEGIYKCTTESGVSFQSNPCTEGATMFLALQSTAKAEARSDDDAGARTSAGAVSPGRVAIYSSRDELQPGMSDLEVLNNRRWGKPQRITRHRETSAWHEYWNYMTGANGGKQLHFINSRLASIDDFGPLTPGGSMTPAVMSQER